MAQRPELEAGLRSLPGAFAEFMDLERDLGVYREPNVWMRHPVGAGS